MLWVLWWGQRAPRNEWGESYSVSLILTPPLSSSPPQFMLPCFEKSSLMIVLVSKDLHLYCIWSWRKVMSGITYSMYRPSIFTVKNEFSTPRFWIQSFSWFCWPPTWCVAAFPSHSRLCLSSIASLVDGLPSTFGSLQIHWNFSSSSYSFHCWRFIA